MFRGAGALARAVPIYAASLPDDLAAPGEHAEALVSALLRG